MNWTASYEEVLCSERNVRLRTACSLSQQMPSHRASRAVYHTTLRGWARHTPRLGSRVGVCIVCVATAPNAEQLMNRASSAAAYRRRQDCVLLTHRRATLFGELLDVTALLAGVIPAWRASRVDPADALRSE